MALGDSLQGVIGDAFGAFQFSGALGALKIGLIVIIAALLGTIVIIIMWRWRRYNIDAFIQTLRHGKEVTGRDKMGIFKNKGVYYAKLWKRKNIYMELPNFEQIVKDRGYPDTVLLSQIGPGEVYQLTFPTIPEELKTRVIDHNIIRLASMQLREDQQIYATQLDWLDKYGIHIAWLVLIIVQGIIAWLWLRKADQVIATGNQGIALAKSFLDAAINVARPGG